MTEVAVPTTPATRERNASAALALKIAGASYEEVAQALGFADDVQAREAVEGQLARMAYAADPAERERQRALTNARLERLMRSVWQRATNARDPEQLSAARVVLALEDRRVRLYGLDAPTEISVSSPTVAEIDAWVAAVVGRSEYAAVEEGDIMEAQVVDDDGSAA